MRVFVWLFQAEVKDASAIRSTVTTLARQQEEWKHLAIPGVDGPEMNKLEKLARPKRPKGSSKLGGELLDRSKVTDTPFTAVSTMTPEFVAALAALDAAAAEAMGKAWAEQLDGVTEEHAVKLVSEMAEFARTATRAGSPVLELIRM
jgi:hypothetical protein